MPEEGFSNAFAHYATADQIALCKSGEAADRTRVHPGFRSPWRSKPSWFLIAEEDPITAPEKVIEVSMAVVQETQP